MKTIGYIRVSSDKQATDGTSLDSQIEKIISFCKIHDLGIPEIIKDEGFSGYKGIRPGFNSVIEQIKNNQVDAVVVYSISRFARNIKQTSEVMELIKTNKIKFYSITEGMNLDVGSPMGSFLINLFASLAQFESEQSGQRIKDVKRFNRANGLRYSSPIYGFDNKEKILTVNPVEMDVVKTIIDLHTKGWSMNEICIMLNNKGIKTKRGNIWFRTQIRKVLLKKDIYEKHI